MSLLLQLPRDDRLFVMNLRKGWVTDTGRTTEVETSPYRTCKQASNVSARQEWVLTTYRNTPCLPERTSRWMQTYRKSSSVLIRGDV